MVHRCVFGECPTGFPRRSGLTWGCPTSWPTSRAPGAQRSGDLRRASQVEVRLPRPKDATRVRIGGGASDVELIRPAGVPVRVHIGGGVSKLAIDEFRLGSAGGKTDWRSPSTIRLQVGTTSRSAPEPVRSLSEPRAGCGSIGWRCGCWRRDSPRIGSSLELHGVNVVVLAGTVAADP